MATYYVKPAAQGGNNALAGTSPATAWATVAYALTSSSGFASGDTLYIAPGVYTDTISVTMPNPTVETNIIGDPTASQFSGFTAGAVVITNYNSTLAGSGYNGNIITATTKNFLHFQNIKFAISNNSAIAFTTCVNTKFTKCSFISNTSSANLVSITSPSAVAVNCTITKCVFHGGNQHVVIVGQSIADGTSITDSIFLRASNTSLYLDSVQVGVYNCIMAYGSYGVIQQPGSLTYPTVVRNSLLFRNAVDLICVFVNNTIIENYNRLLSPTPRNNVANNGTSSSDGDIGIDFFESLLWGINNIQPFTSYASSPNASFGNATGAPATDIYGVTWTGSSPDTGAGTYRVITSVPSNVGYVANMPVNTQATTIAIFSNSTSQSIEVYLGATGLTSSTVGLSATYNKNRTADVVIPLVTRTIAQPWIAGGFAEVNQTTMPGVYRLDIPNEAISAGYGNTTIVIRGASGTNGAVVTIQEPPPIGTQLRMGPFTVQADGILTDDRLKLIQGSVHSIDFKMVDAYGTGVDGTGTVVTARVYNVAGFLIDTYTCTAMYALDGRYSFAIDSTVTDNVGMYTINIYRQIGTETNVFGRMKLEVLSP